MIVMIDNDFQIGKEIMKQKRKKNDELDFIQIRKHLLIENHSKENENPGHKLGENIVINKSENTLYSAYKKYI